MKLMHKHDGLERESGAGLDHLPAKKIAWVALLSLIPSMFLYPGRSRVKPNLFKRRVGYGHA